MEKNQLRLLRERGADMTIFSPRASAMAPHVGDEAVSKAWARADNDLIARCVAALSRDLRRRLHAAAVARRPISPSSIAELERCVERARLHRLQPQSRSRRRPFHQPAADRRVLVPVLREDGRAGRAGNDPRLGQLQPGLHATGAYYIAADTIAFMQLIAGRPVRRLPDFALHHSARRRRGALSLGPLSRARRHAQAADPRRRMS